MPTTRGSGPSRPRSCCTWCTPFTTRSTGDPPFAKWFADGELNAAYNCVDRHVEAGLGDKVATTGSASPARRGRSPIPDLHARELQGALGVTPPDPAGILRASNVQFRRVIGQSVGLPVFVHLQPVFQVAQELVGRGQARVFAVGRESPCRAGGRGRDRCRRGAPRARGRRAGAAGTAPGTRCRECRRASA